MADPVNQKPAAAEGGKEMDVGKGGDPVEASTLSEEQAIRAKRLRDRAVDGADAANMGGAGAQGSQTDFGEPKNFLK